MNTKNTPEEMVQITTALRDDPRTVLEFYAPDACKWVQSSGRLPDFNSFLYRISRVPDKVYRVRSVKGKAYVPGHFVHFSLAEELCIRYSGIDRWKDAWEIVEFEETQR